MSHLRIGLCGTGNVGSAFIDTIQNSSDLISENYGVDVSISLIGSRSGKVNNSRNIEIVNDIFDVPLSENVDIVVELMGGVDDPLKLACLALENKKHFVTANKALIAAHSKELFSLAKQHNVHIGFEASVAGGIPIIRTIRDGLLSSKINSFAGILNGTSNFIFSRMSDDELAFEKALLLAQKEGFAEPDPTFDISGQDAAQKTSILATLSFSMFTSMEKVFFDGIDKVTLQDINFGKQLNYVIKPVSLGISSQNEIMLGSFPAFVKKDSLLASIQEENNAVLINTENAGGTMYSGPGAGANPTANSVLTDVIDVAKNKVFNYEKFIKNSINTDFEKFACDRYLKLIVEDKSGVVAKISTLLAEFNLSIDNLIQKELDKAADDIPLVIVISNSTEKIILKVISKLEELKEVQSVSHIRILNI